MIFLLHGDNIDAIQKNIEQITKGRKTVSFDTKKTLFSEIEEQIISRNLFGEDRVFMIQNPSVLNAASIKKFSEIKKGISPDIVFVEHKKIAKKAILEIPDKIYLHQLPNYFFEFLDTLTPANGRKSSMLLDSILSHTSAEMVYYSIIKRIRLLLAVKSGKIDEYDEAKSLSDWQLSKIKKQSQEWSIAKLLKFHKKLFQIEKDMKTGNALLPLEKHLDIVILSTLFRQ